MITSCVGTPLLLPSSSLPLLMQIPSSPVSKEQFSNRTFLLQSRSSASVLVPNHGFFTVRARIVTCSLKLMWVVHAGEFSNVTPSINTFLQLKMRIIFGRRKSLTLSKSASVFPSVNFPILFSFKPLNAFSDEYQVFLSSVSTSPYFFK